MEMLDPDRIAELVEAAKDGRLPESPSPSARRASRLRTVDFSRPTKFGADHQRRLVRTTELFCQTAGTRLASELRHAIEFEVLGTTQLTWAGARSQIPPGSLHAVLEIESTGTRLLFTVEQALVVICLECLLGGSPDKTARDRKFSEIDWTLAHSLFESLLRPLMDGWEELAGVTLTLGEIGQPESVPVAAISEPTFGTQIEARIDQRSYSLALLVPWASIEPIETVISGREADDEADGPRTPLLQAPMATVPVTVRAEVAHAELAVAEILALAPGSVVSFDSAADDGVDVYADNVPIARARPGRQGPRRAVQLTELRVDGR